MGSNPKYSIDKAKFKGDDYRYLKNKIIEKYKEILPNYEIKIEYKKSKKEYKFIISKKENIINDSSGNLNQIDIYLYEYSNSSAINIFAPEKKDELYQKYYYDQIDYFEQLQEFLDSIVTLYRLQNINLEWDIESDKSHFTVYGPRPGDDHIFSWRPLKVFYLKYSDCVTKDEFEIFKKDIIKFADSLEK